MELLDPFNQVFQYPIKVLPYRKHINSPILFFIWNQGSWVFLSHSNIHYYLCLQIHSEFWEVNHLLLMSLLKISKCDFFDYLGNCLLFTFEECWWKYLSFWMVWRVLCRLEDNGAFGPVAEHFSLGLVFWMEFVYICEDFLDQLRVVYFDKDVFDVVKSRDWRYRFSRLHNPL